MDEARVARFIVGALGMSFDCLPPREQHVYVRVAGDAIAALAGPAGGGDIPQGGGCVRVRRHALGRVLSTLSSAQSALTEAAELRAALAVASGDGRERRNRMTTEEQTDDPTITIDPRDRSDATLRALVADLAAEIPSMIAAPDDDPRSHRILAVRAAVWGAVKRYNVACDLAASARTAMALGGPVDLETVHAYERWRAAASQDIDDLAERLAEGEGVTDGDLDPPSEVVP